MGHDYATSGASNNMGDFTVTKSNPGTTVVRFTVSDGCSRLTTSKMIRAVLADAIDQWIADERSDLDANGDASVKGSDEYPLPGDGFSAFTWNFSGKYAEVTLTALTNISTSGDITVSIPYADVA